MKQRQIEVLREALDLEPAQREAFVIATCGNDTALRDAVLHLLMLDQQDDTLLDAPIDALAAALVGDDTTNPSSTTPILQPGERIGSWHIINLLGTGGMGSVWLAERDDAGFAQRAALKLIKPGMDSQAVLHSFQRERELLARLEHPGIAHLIDGGIDAQGRSWYAMRYVEGQTLDHWLQTAPPLAARLQLFLALCRIVAHAHRQLVVHRDLKPGNVMVQPDGSPCLLDFGIAKILQQDPGQNTATIAHFVSPAYAAPEQMTGGNISTAADVYALGAILFELLTDTRYSTVYRGGDISTRPSQAVLRSGTTSPIALPVQKLRGDLDAITSQALAPDPLRRYDSADALADDVQRYLEGRPVLARRDSLVYRTRKWIQRNRMASLALLLALVALLAGTGISLWQADRATREAQRANAVKDYLIGLFDAGRTNTSGTAALERRIVDVLEDSATKLKQDLADQPDIRDEIYTLLIEIFDSNEAGPRSRQLAQERLTMAEEAFGPDDGRIAPALLMLVGVSLNHDELEAIPSLLDRAQTLLDHDGRRDTLSYALMLRFRAQMVGNEQGHGETSLELLSQSNQLLRRHHPDSDDLLVNLMITAQSAVFAQQFDTALATIEELRQRTRDRYSDNHQIMAQADMLEGRLYLMNGQAQQALDVFRRSRTRIEHYSGANHNDVLVARYLETKALLALQRFDEADVAWHAVEDLRQAHFADNANFADALANLREQIDAGLVQDTANR